MTSHGEMRNTSDHKHNTLTSHKCATRYDIRYVRYGHHYHYQALHTTVKHEIERKEQTKGNPKAESWIEQNKKERKKKKNVMWSVRPCARRLLSVLVLISTKLGVSFVHLIRGKFLFRWRIFNNVISHIFMFFSFGRFCCSK